MEHMFAARWTAIRWAALALAIALVTTLGILQANILLFVTGGVAAISAALLATWFCRRHPSVFLAAAAGIIALTPKTGATPIVSVGVAILPIDFLIVVGIASGAIGVRRLVANARKASVYLIGFAVLVFVQLARGFLDHGTTAMIEARNTLAFIAILAFVLSQKDSAKMATLIKRWVYVAAVLLAIIAAYNVAFSGLGSANYGMVLSDGSTTTSRVITSSQAFVVAAALILALRDVVVDGRTRFVALVVVFAVVVAVAQHRSVWAATALAILVYLLLERPRERLARTGLVFAWLACLAIPGLIMFGGDAWGTLVDSLSTASLSSGTGGGRTESTEDFLRQIFSEENPLLPIFGYTYGSGWTRVVMDMVVNFSPHNSYVEALMRVGIVGAIALVLSILAAGLRVRRSAALLALVVLTAVYCFPYGLPYGAALLLGLAFLYQELPLASRKAADESAARAASKLVGTREREAHIPSRV